MIDNDVMRAIQQVLLPRLQRRFGPDIQMIQTNTPDQPGADYAPRVYVQKLFDKPHGSPREEFPKEIPIGTPPHQIPTRWVQVMESLYQFSCLFEVNVNDSNQPTAADIAKYVVFLMGTSVIQAEFRDKGLFLQKTSDVRNPYWDNDEDSFQARPNFDVILQHWDYTVLEIPMIDAFGVDLHRV